ncbi:hypothetical protein LZ32DRAFT_8777 [Colletotrichum eremochloae]|nr:hypothetical protein LZ32DRAFT_8777 [Colletotrichum eremochloae]
MNSQTCQVAESKANSLRPPHPPFGHSFLHAGTKSVRHFWLSKHLRLRGLTWHMVAPAHRGTGKGLRAALTADCSEICEADDVSPLPLFLGIDGEEGLGITTRVFRHPKIARKGEGWGVSMGSMDLTYQGTNTRRSLSRSHRYTIIVTLLEKHSTLRTSTAYVGTVFRLSSHKNKNKRKKGKKSVPSLPSRRFGGPGRKET